MHLPRTRTLTVALATVVTLSGLAAPATAAGNGACTDPSGVTVVVDFTDVGGAVETGCATAPTTGTDALQQAGFVDTRDASGLICAIDATPDPCPATFTGSYWSYWSAPAGGEWESYQVGSDTSTPAPGSVEGWRYFDGSAGPTIAAPAAATAEASTEASTEASAESSATPSAEPTATQEATLMAATDAAEADSTGGTSPWPWLVGLTALVAAAAATFVVRRRRTDA